MQAHEAMPRAARLLFGVTVMLGSLVCWLAPYPPMTDLPEHAAQVVLWRDLLLGGSPWASLFEIHLLTPYLIGYGLALPLSFVMPIAAALKLLLWLAYLAFVGLCVLLRRRLGGDPRLDWLFPLGYFGLAWEWGFLTFLVAAPVALAVFAAALRHAEHRDARSALLLTLAGLALLFSHGLMFAYGFLVAIALHAARAGWRRPGWRDAAPYLVVAGIAVAVFAMGLAYERRYPPAPAPVVWDASLWRVPQAFRNALGMKDAWLVPLALGVFAAPWLLGARIGRDRFVSAMPLLVTASLLAALPHVAMNTSFIHHRFALFLLPAYAWAFGPARAHGVAAWRRPLAVSILIAACWTSIGVHAARVWRFGGEARDFEAAMQAVEPGQRALSLVFDPGSEAADSDHVYLHHANWYQALRAGVVDPSFALLRPQVVRYRPDKLPGVGLGFEWNPAQFDWHRHRGDDYRYFFVRHADPVPQGLFRGADCPPVPRASHGRWTVYERTGCGDEGGRDEAPRRFGLP